MFLGKPKNRQRYKFFFLRQKKFVSERLQGLFLFVLKKKFEWMRIKKGRPYLAVPEYLLPCGDVLSYHNDTLCRMVANLDKICSRGLHVEGDCLNV